MTRPAPDDPAPSTSDGIRTADSPRDELTRAWRELALALMASHGGRFEGWPDKHRREARVRAVQRAVEALVGGSEFREVQR